MNRKITAAALVLASLGAAMTGIPNKAIRWLPCNTRAVSRYWTVPAWSHHSLPTGEIGE